VGWISNFRQFDRATGFLLPPSLDEWLPERHLARFVVEVIDGLDLSTMVKSYRGSGSACYHPALLLACWFAATRQESFRAARILG
jgi:transposase